MTTIGSRNNHNRREEEIGMRTSHPEWSAQQWLAACGHPGYSERFAQQVWSILLSKVAESRGMNSFDAIQLQYQRAGS